MVSVFSEKKTPVIPVVSKSDLRSDEENQEFAEKLREQTKEKVCIVSAKTGAGIAELKEWMIRMVPEGFGGRTITGDLVSEGEVVLLVMPQDIQAPKGRLILPQVQTMRELLDKKCIDFKCHHRQTCGSHGPAEKSPKTDHH